MWQRFSLVVVVVVAFVGLCGYGEVHAQESDSQPAQKLTNTLNMSLLLIPAGEFLMGAPEDDDLAEKHERKQHKVRIGQAFYLNAHEVTVGQFRAFVKETGFKTAAETDGEGASGYNAEWRGFEYHSDKYSWRNPGYEQTDRHPVVNVNWLDAQAFCAWLSKKEGRKYRLPTEAEWEYACRAGATQRFVRGDAVKDLKLTANMADQSLAAKWDTSTVKKYGLDPQVVKFQAWNDDQPFTAPVGKFEPNAWGLYDMLGNAGEFCSDWYQSDYYDESPELNPMGPVLKAGPPAKKLESHVVRGGTFLNGPGLVRTTSRVACLEEYRNYVIGFRVVLEMEKTR